MKNVACDLFFPLMVSILLLVQSCSLPDRPASPTVKAGEEITPAQTATILLFSENLRFVRMNGFTGGSEIHRDQINELARLLQKEGVDVEVREMDGGEASMRDLARSRMIYIVDTFCIYPEFRALLEEYVRGGGVVVGIGEVGRFAGTWTKEWLYADLFGLDMKPVDPWETCVSWADRNFYRYSRVMAGNEPLLQGIGDPLDMGEEAVTAMVMKPRSATVAASLDRYLFRSSEENPPETVADSFPAISLNRFGQGVAIYVSVLPSGRKKGGWEKAPQMVKVLARAPAYAREKLRVTGWTPSPVPGWNQVAYGSDWAKEITLRLKNADRPPRGHFAVYGEDGRILREGVLKPWGTQLWGSCFGTIDLSAVKEKGHYRVDVTTDDGCFPIAFKVDDLLFKQQVAASQLHFFREMRCGEKCHASDPVRGGYHDATGDWGVRMWSMPHVVWCLARYLESDPTNESARAELGWAVDWCLKMQAPDGSVYASIRPPEEDDGSGSPIEIRPWQDKTVREVEKRVSFEYTATYGAGLARAAKVLGRGGDVRAASCVEAARKAYGFVQRQGVSRTAELGNRSWAALELYRATGERSYVEEAKRDIAKILPRQLEKGRVKGTDVYGAFFADTSRTTFSPQQWKAFHSIGIYLGMIELYRALDSTDAFRTGVKKAVDRFAGGYLIGMSSLSPYGQMACGLEPDGGGLFKVYSFSHPESWIRDHGLNCDLLAMATVAMEWYRETGMPQLKQVAERQLNWVLGNNPLGFCMIDGLGETNPPVIDDSLGTGRITGGIPNGIIGRPENNWPYWGASWDSREYWLPQNAYLLSTLGGLAEP